MTGMGFGSVLLAPVAGVTAFSSGTVGAALVEIAAAGMTESRCDCLWVEQLLCGFAEFGSEVGVGYCDELVGSLPDGLAQQPGDSVLRYYRVGDVSGDSDDLAGVELGHDCGDRA